LVAGLTCLVFYLLFVIARIKKYSVTDSDSESSDGSVSNENANSNDIFKVLKPSLEKLKPSLMTSDTSDEEYVPDSDTEDEEDKEESEYIKKNLYGKPIPFSFKKKVVS